VAAEADTAAMPTSASSRKTALRNELPVDRITQVRVLDPYFQS